MKSDELSISLLTGEDAPALARLEAECFTLPWTEEQYRAVFAKGASVDAGANALPPVAVFGIRDGEGNLLAYVSLGIYHAAKELEIYNIAVRKDRRCTGLGAKLLEAALRVAAARGVETAFLEVREGNIPALSLYAKFGFIRCGLRKKYYEDTGEDAVVMRCELSRFMAMPE